MTEPNRLVIDCGGTSLGYLLTGRATSVKGKIPTGYNAISSPSGALVNLLNTDRFLIGEALLMDIVEFYGAGCATPQACERVRRELAEFFPKARVTVDSDMVGAARAVCPGRPGIVCILGTGSNSCLWDGSRITANVPPLGFIIGDEGSGAVLGRLFFEHLFKGLLPEAVTMAFYERYGLTVADVITRVYRAERPNAFLASFAPFIRELTSEKAVYDLVFNEFCRFIRFNVERYPEARSLPVAFVGSVAWHFADILRAACTSCSIICSVIIPDPLMVE